MLVYQYLVRQLNDADQSTFLEDPVSTTPAPQARKVPRHLHDPANPRRTASDEKSLTNVQRWTMSVLAVTTILHMAIGVVAAAVFIDEPRPGARVGLLVTACLFGMIAVGSGLAIHGHKLLSPWLLLGWLPSLVGALVLWA